MHIELKSSVSIESHSPLKRLKTFWHCPFLTPCTKTVMALSNAWVLLWKWIPHQCKAQQP